MIVPWDVLRGDLLYVLPCAILFLCCFFFFSPFSIAITSLGEEKVNLSTFRMFDRFVLVWICRFPLPLDLWEGLRFVIVALPGLFSYLFSTKIANHLAPLHNMAVRPKNRKKKLQTTSPLPLGRLQPNWIGLFLGKPLQNC